MTIERAQRYIKIPNHGVTENTESKTSCLRLKLVELNFFASFNADDQRKTYVSNVSKQKYSLRLKCLCD